MEPYEKVLSTTFIYKNGTLHFCYVKNVQLSFLLSFHKVFWQYPRRGQSCGETEVGPHILLAVWYLYIVRYFVYFLHPPHPPVPVK